MEKKKMMKICPNVEVVTNGKYCGEHCPFILLEWDMCELFRETLKHVSRDDGQRHFRCDQCLAETGSKEKPVDPRCKDCRWYDWESHKSAQFGLCHLEPSGRVVENEYFCSHWVEPLRKPEELPDEQEPAAGDQIQCPACGSRDVVTKVEREEYTPPFGQTVRYLMVVDTCRACKEQGDFEDRNSEPVAKVMREADQRSVGIILDSLAADGMTMPYLDRILIMPPGTLESWKTECSPGELALLRVLRNHSFLFKPDRYVPEDWKPE